MESSTCGKPSVFGAGGAPIPTSAFANPYAFTGRRIDWLPAGAGEHKPIYHYRARWYDPEHGRFGQRDPLEFVDGMNVYEYVASSPAALADPSGKAKCCDGRPYKPKTHVCCNKIIYKKKKDHVCCEGCDNKVAYLELESIWICTRALAGGAWAIWKLSHSYVCCDGVNRNCFGKQARQPKPPANGQPGDPPGEFNGPPTKKGDPIPKEYLASGECEEVKVCPKVKCDKCKNPKANDDYDGYPPGPVGTGENCHEWAWCGVPGY